MSPKLIVTSTAALKPSTVPAGNHLALCVGEGGLDCPHRPLLRHQGPLSRQGSFHVSLYTGKLWFRGLGGPAPTH